MAKADLLQKAMNQGHSAAWDQDWDRAAGFYRQALAEDPNHPQAVISLALALFEQRLYDESLRYYLQAAQLLPADPLPVEKSGQIYERQGKVKDAVAALLKAAELHLKARDAEKAIDAWARVINLEPDQLTARSWLARVFESMGRKEEAVMQYLALAAIFQAHGDLTKAKQALEYTAKMSPDSREVNLALSMLRSNQPLPRPGRSAEKAASLRMAQVHRLQPDVEEGMAETPDPVQEARQKALVLLAGLLFENESESSGRPDGLGKSRKALGQAIDHLTQERQQEQPTEAIKALQEAVDAGLKHPAAQFLLGMLLSQQKNERSQRYLQQTVRLPEYALASNFLMAQYYHQQEQFSKAVVLYLQALRLADGETVAPDQVNELGQLYEPLIDAQQRVKKSDAQKKMCENIAVQLLRPNWRQYLRHARSQLPPQEMGNPPVPLAEILLETQSGEMIAVIARVRQLANKGLSRSAMEEAYFALDYAPTYLPLHTQIGDLLVAGGRLNEAVEKFLNVANLYQVRGELDQTGHMLRRILQLAPSDLSIRTRLIDLLISQGKVDDALQAMMDLAEFYSMMADLASCRDAYMNAAALAPQSRNHREWSVKILTRVADIDMQTLNWRQALRIYEQIRTQQPEDVPTLQYIILLNFKLGQNAAAINELNSLAVSAEKGQRAEVIICLTNLIQEFPDMLELRRLLADVYARDRKISLAVEQLDFIADALFNAGHRPEAVNVLEAIIRLNPPNVGDYQTLLSQMR